ncbi:MAG: porin, partial [Bacteroidota bacterium]
YPITLGKQIIEPGVQAYAGLWEMPKTSLSSGVKTTEDLNYKDERLAGTFILYPKPFGIQAEYNFGKGPEFNPVTDSIETQKLQGGYVTLSYKLNVKGQTLFPFVRYQYYDGGKKHELDARSYKVEELELGIEWEPVKQFELVVMYTMSSRRFEDYVLQDNYQRGNLLRIQAQVNF